jgi:histidinol-phosphate aminotransferase/threonine-phosphate decarboxylase
MDPDAVDGLRGDSETAASGDATAIGAGRVPHGSSENPQVLDFSANTNPVRPDSIAQVYDAALSAAESYPSEDYYEFRAAAADYVGCEATEVIPTAGGLAAIRLAIATTVRSGEDVLVPTPSFAEYAREVRLQGATPERVPHDEVLGADPGEYAFVVVCTPNNPTGDAYDPDALRAFAKRCRAADTPLLVDEAFIDFTNLLSLAGTDGVIVARSLTKIFGLPGIRSGFAVATGTYRDRLETARLAWGLSSVAASVGTHCLGDRQFVRETRERVASERARLADRLSARFDVHPSDAPFLLLDCGDSATVDELIEAVQEYDIAVRDARTFEGLDHHIRVAVRLPHENDLLLDALDV